MDKDFLEWYEGPGSRLATSRSRYMVKKAMFKAWLAAKEIYGIAIEATGPPNVYYNSDYHPRSIKKIECND